MDRSRLSRSRARPGDDPPRPGVEDEEQAEEWWKASWLERAKGPVLWIVLGVAIAMMGRFFHIIEQILLMIDALVLVAIYIGGTLLILNVGFGQRNALGEFIELMGRCMKKVRKAEPLDPTVVQFLGVLALRTTGTLLFAAILGFAVLSFFEKSSVEKSFKKPPDTEEQAAPPPE
ncbi:MAG: hypothetical protein OXC08_18845 [Thiotrichales bacterium]|nr:hypothetical protein [Thiotrichales bacterium]